MTARNVGTQDPSLDRLVTPTPVARHRAPQRPGDPALRRALWYAAAWALPVVAYLLHVAWVVPIVVLLGTAALLPAGRSLVDRLVLAGALLYGIVCVAGLPLSVWPWHLHPVPVGGLALTALVAIGLRTRRRPSLPRPTLADGLSLAAAGLLGLVVAIPSLLTSQADRLSTLVVGEDGLRHFIQLDTVRQLGGYLFMHPEVSPIMTLYPHGWHLVFGLLDGFVRSSTELGSGLSAVDHYLAYTVFTYAAFALAVIWGIQRVAEPLLTPGRRIVLVGVAVAYLFGDETFRLVVLHFTPQIAGLGQMVVLAAVLVRPPARTGLTLWLVSALLVSVGVTYSLYLPPAVLIVLVWLFVRRRLVLRHRRALAATVVAGVLASLPLAFGLLLGNQSASLQAPTGSMWSIDATLVWVGVVAAGLLRSWWVPRWRALTVILGIGILCLIGIYVLTWLQGGSGGSFYYAFKVRHLFLALLVLGGGALLTLLPPPQRPEPAWRWREWATWPPAVRRLAPATALAIALAAGSGLVSGDSPFQPNGSVFARQWLRTPAPEVAMFLPRAALSETRREVPPGTITMVIFDVPSQAFLSQTVVSGVLRQYVEIIPSLYGVPYRTPGYYDRFIEALPPRPVLIVVESEESRQIAEELRQRHPDRDITIEFVLE